MDNVMEMMQKIVDDIDRSSVTMGDRSIPLCSVSIGTTVFPNRLCGEVSTAEAEAILYNQADVAMYKTKALSEKEETRK
jgi:GGDEF domain-containing protein